MGSGVREESTTCAGDAQEVRKNVERRRYFTVVTRPSYPEKNLIFLKAQENDCHILHISVSSLKRICLENGSVFPWIQKTKERGRVQALFPLA
jgi:hypothetical protein